MECRYIEGRGDGTALNSAVALIDEPVLMSAIKRHNLSIIGLTFRAQGITSQSCSPLSFQL